MRQRSYCRPRRRVSPEEWACAERFSASSSLPASTAGSQPPVAANSRGHERLSDKPRRSESRWSVTRYDTSERAAASEPRERSAPAKRRARERVGESEGRSPSEESSASIEKMVPSIRRATSAASLLCAASLTIAMEGTSRAIPPPAPRSQSAPTAQAAEQHARVTCSGCHLFPPPDILPRDMWREEFVQMMLIRENRQPPTNRATATYRALPLPPDMEEALSFFVSRAPEHLPRPEPWPAVGQSPVRFARHYLTLP